MNYLTPITDKMTLEEAEKHFKDSENLYHTLGGDVYKGAVSDDLWILQRQLEQKRREQSPKEIVDWYEVLDVLGGYITGDYQADLKRLNERGWTCSEFIYQQAEQNLSQP